MIRFKTTALAAGAAALAVGGTTALAGSGVGGIFNLGQTNTVGGTSTLTGETAAPQLTVKNTSANTSATALNLSVAAGRTPFKVNSAVKVSNLNADQLDGKDSTAFYGAGSKVANADKLDGQDAVAFLGATAKATDADKLDGKDSAGFWKAGGNAGTTPGTDFIGTTDNQALELKVNGERAFRLEPASSFGVSSPDVIGGFSGNAVSGSWIGATIAGGGVAGSPNTVTGHYAAVGGGRGNVAGAIGTVSGGSGNSADTVGSVGGGANNSAVNQGTVAGGASNTASGAFNSTVGGGYSNTASGHSATVAGGLSNVASGDAATVAGGESNTAGGDSSFAAGYRAKATHAGSFVWGDSTDADFASTAADQFLVRAGGGARFVRGGSTFSPTGAALQAENATGGGEAAWFRVGAASPHAVVSLIKQDTGTGNFLTCWNESGGSFSSKCHIDKDGAFVGGSDFAESLPVRGAKARYQPGDVLAISRRHAGEVVKSRHARDAAVIGVYSTRPGVLGADKGGITRVGRDEIPVAITGIVPVKVSAENGAIRPGDLLTSSSLPGRAMRAGVNPAVGTVLGKSLGFLRHGQGVVKALVMQR